MKKMIAFAAVLFILSAANVYAFSCRGKFISNGMQDSGVFDLCGEPADIRSWQEDELTNRVLPGYIIGGNIVVVPETVLVTYEEWTYNLGRNHFMRFLTFKDGRLVRMTQGGYGY